MPRIRSIKHGFFTNDRLADCSPLARLLFIGLWTLADREGRLEDRPRKIKAELLPFDECDVDKLLGELAERGFVTRYEVAGKPLLEIVNFTKHQNPHKMEAASEFPAPIQPRKDEESREMPGKNAANPGMPRNAPDLPGMYCHGSGYGSGYGEGDMRAPAREDAPPEGESKSRWEDVPWQERSEQTPVNPEAEARLAEVREVVREVFGWPVIPSRRDGQVLNEQAMALASARVTGDEIRCYARARDRPIYHPGFAADLLTWRAQQVGQKDGAGAELTERQQQQIAEMKLRHARTGRQVGTPARPGTPGAGGSRP